MRSWIFASCWVFAAGAAAQTFPSQEPRNSAPAPGMTSDQNLRQPTPDRHQFSSPVMRIQIEGGGLTVPSGVERDSPYSPPASPVPEKPPVTEKGRAP